MEEEMRSRAKEGQINLSKAQLAVAKHHKDKKVKDDAAAASAASTSSAAMDD